MPDDIATSLKLTEWLKGQGTPPIKIDKFAPCVVTGTPPYIAMKMHVDGDFLSPYFGPGGEGNLLKAIRAWCEKNSLLLHQVSNGKHLPGWKISKAHKRIERNPIGFDKKTHWTSTVASAAARETDGIALRDLLVKLMEAK